MIEVTVARDEDTPPQLLAPIRLLLEESFEGRFDAHDWDHCCDGWRAYALDGGVPLAHAAVVARELLVDGEPYAAGYVEAVATAVGRWNAGAGSRVVSAITEVVREHFELGALATGRHSFYERLGWERFTGKSYVLRAGEHVRTADEDAGLMLLRFGASAAVPLTAALTCHERPGDDW